MSDDQVTWVPPPRPEWLTTFNAEGQHTDLRNLVPLDAGEMVETAKRATGFDDRDLARNAPKRRRMYRCSAATLEAVMASGLIFFANPHVVLAQAAPTQELPPVVVAALGQDVPELPAQVAIVRDEIEGKGPLGGLAAGLAALEGKAVAGRRRRCPARPPPPRGPRRYADRRRIAAEPPSPNGGSMASPRPRG